MPSQSDEALLTACVSGNVYGVRRALQSGAALTAVNAEGFTAICIAAERGHAAVLDVLCDAGLDPGMQGGAGWTPRCGPRGTAISTASTPSAVGPRPPVRVAPVLSSSTP